MISVLLVSSSLSFAGSVSFDFRFESDSSSYNGVAKMAGATDSSRFSMRTGRVDFKGKLNEDVFFRMRFGIDHNADASLYKIDNFSTQVDYAYIQHRFSDTMAATVGKFASEAGSIEGGLSSADIYQPSLSYRAISSNGFLYLSGVKLTYTQSGQEMSIYLANQSESSSTQQTKMAYGFIYKPQFHEKTWQFVLSYLNDEKQETASNARMTTKISSVGVKWDRSSYYASLDYIAHIQKNITAINVDDDLTTLLLDTGYDFNGTIPKFKYERSTKKTGIWQAQYDGVAVGFEFKPYPEDIFRYHVMLTQMTVKPNDGESHFEQHILVGTRIYGDFLK